MWRKALGLGLACAALAGCADPLVTLNEPSAQYKTAHPVDWQNLADRQVDAFAATLHASPPTVYVAPGPADMPFAAAYRTYLEEALMARGYPISQRSGDSVVLSFRVQSFLYGEDGRRFPADYATFWTSLGAIGAELRHISSLDTGLAGLAIAGPVTDVLREIGGKTRAEAIVTLSVEDPDRVHYLSSESIYLKPQDLPLYWTKLAPAAPMTMPTETSLDTERLPVVSLR